MHKSDPYTKGLEVYCVGGAVRDSLLGLPQKDRDWVVIGTTALQMIERGFIAVGRDFPVFLHPITHEEYALARTERKTSPGYKGFVVHASPEVTLEEDLSRRDLTINAIAQKSDGSLVDPYEGRKDLHLGVLRHVTRWFCEDPVRVLRLARFSARFSSFKIAQGTISLARKVVSNGEIEALVPERVWQEIRTGLMEATPSFMFETLWVCNALQKVLPELEELWPTLPEKEELQNSNTHVVTAIHEDRSTEKYFSPADSEKSKRLKNGIKWEPSTWAMESLNLAAKTNLDLSVRFSLLVLPLTEFMPENSVLTLLKKMVQRLRIPKEIESTSQCLIKNITQIKEVQTFNYDQLLDLCVRLDGIRKPERLKQILAACAIANCKEQYSPLYKDNYPNIRENPLDYWISINLSTKRVLLASEIIRSARLPKTFSPSMSAAQAIRSERLVLLQKNTLLNTFSEVQ